MRINLDYNSETPIYKQIASEVIERVNEGKLIPGDKLPTVRELACQLDLSNGTVKHGYDELLRLGIITMKQGSGTFIAEQPETPDFSRKEKAMEAIDRMLDQLEELHFSSMETEIFLKLKLSERHMADDITRLVVVDCNREALDSMISQIEQEKDCETYGFLLEDLQKNPDRVGEEMDLMVTTHTHMGQVERITEEGLEVVPVVLSPSRDTVVQLARLAAGTKVCILSSSPRFGQIVAEGLASINPEVQLLGRLSLKEAEEVPKEAEAVILPGEYMGYINPKEERALRECCRDRKQISYRYMVDKGSMMYLMEKISEKERKKKLGL